MTPYAKAKALLNEYGREVLKSYDAANIVDPDDSAHTFRLEFEQTGRYDDDKDQYTQHPYLTAWFVCGNFYGNPTHPPGPKLVAWARRCIAARLQCDPNDVEIGFGVGQFDARPF